MITLEVADLVVIAGRALELDTAEVLDILDLAAAERALTQARPDSDMEDLAGHAAVLLDALVRGRPLRRGNRLVALAAMLQFLALNGQELDPEPPERVATLVADLAVGAVDVKTVADQLAPRLHPARGKKEASMPGRPVRLVMKLKDAATRTPSGKTGKKTGKGVFARFTDRSRRAVWLATQEARLLGHDYVSSEHLLLGLLSEGEGVAARALASLGISREDVRSQVEEITGPGPGSPPDPLPFTPRIKKVLDLSLREALELGHTYVGTEHLLLALLRDGDGVGARALAGLGADDARIRERVLDLLRDESRRAASRDRLAADRGDGAIVAENQRLHEELNRLRALLREHGIDPDAGTARTA